MFRGFLDGLMGSSGRALLAGIEKNKTLFLVVIFIYASILIYSKLILHHYYPRKMKQLIQEWPEVVGEDELMALWREQKRTFKWFILIPSKNELWVRKASKSPDRLQLLYFNRKDVSQSDYAKMMEIKGAEN